MILVIGSTGTVGKEIIRELAARKADFRALVRKKSDAEKLNAEGIQTAIGDYAQPESVRAALKGVDRLYLLSPVVLQMTEYEGSVVDAAKNAGVQHIVKHSVMGADSRSPVTLFQWHAAVEEKIKASGVPYTLLRPNTFMQNLAKFYGKSIAKDGVFYDSLEDGQVSYVDTRDIGAVAAVVLTEDGHEGRTYEITGSEALSNTQIADHLSAVLAKKVTYQSISDETMRQGMLSSGTPDWAADYLVALYQLERLGKAATVMDTVEQVTGRKPRMMAGYLQENKAAFQTG